jgi:signal transduction histidine kinase
MVDNAYYAVILFAILITIIIAVFVISIFRYHRRYVKLQKERMFAEITMQENERRRIANDLHDSIGPMLSSVKLNINSIEVKDTIDEQIVQKAGRHLDDIIKNMRQISHNLLPNTLERRGLIEALKEFTANINDSKHIKVQLQIVHELSIAKEKEIHLFRIIQEIVQNTLKHASAKNLQIGLGQENNHVLILTMDDGIGFDVDKAKDKSMGLGMKSLETRTEILNGKLVLESKAGKGTNYFIKIPI